MARPLRLDAPGKFFHVLARGNGRLPIFHDERDRQRFLDLVAEIAEHFEIRCHSFCLMDNHYHLLLQPMRGSLPLAVRQLNGIYAQRFNRRHQRSGHVFEGRYKSLLVDEQSYLIELARYIVLNPVRAGLVATPEEWRWSSYRATAGLDAPPPFLHVEFIRRAAGGRDGDHGALDFRRLVAAASSAESPDLELLVLVEQAVAVGTPPFLAHVGELVASQRRDREIPVDQRMVDRPPLAELFRAPAGKEERNLLIRRAVLDHGYTQSAVAAELGLGRSTISRAIRGGEYGRLFPDE